MLAAELWMQSKLWKDSAPYNSSHQKQPQRRNDLPLFSAVTLSTGDWTGRVSGPNPSCGSKIRKCVESRRSISTREMTFTAWTCADLAVKADLRSQAQHIRAGKLNIMLVADQNSFSFIFQH